MGEHLKDHISIFGAITNPTKCRKGEGVCGIISQIKSALGGKRLVTSISKALSGGSHQAVKFCTRSRLNLELADLDEAVEFLFVHIRRSPSEPKIKIFG